MVNKLKEIVNKSIDKSENSCPYIKHTYAHSDNKFKVYDGLDFCLINNKPCLLESDSRCEIEEEFKNDNGE